jgi:thiol-disulfide isomerase/thioredoxin
MNKKIKKNILEILKYVAIIAIVTNAVSYYRSLDLNKEKFDIKSFKLLDNTTYAVPKDKALLVHFWATWCPTCKFESPNIDKISKDYEVITIAVQSGSQKEIKNYLNEYQLKFKVVNDKDGFYSNKFNIKAFPTTLIYDKDKNLKFSEVGYTTTAGLYSRMALSK